MKELSLSGVITIMALILILAVILTLKICGSTDYVILKEKDGYCKIAYGENYKLDEINGNCYNTKNRSERINFTDTEFREVCPKNEFLSNHFYSDCWYKGDIRNNP